MTPKINVLTRPVSWKFDFDAFFLFEIETEKAKKSLPKTLQPFEVRPGISLASFGLQCFTPGNLQNLPAFFEINCSIMTLPNLSFLMPIPQFACFVISIATNCPKFDQYAAKEDKMPVYKANGLSLELDRKAHRFFVEDQDGPIVELEVSKVEKKYKNQALWIQVLTQQKEGCYLGAVEWKGEFFEYQKHSKVGKLYSHPFFQNLEIEELGEHCHTQMFTPPISPGCDITFHQPQLLIPQQPLKTSY